MKRCLTLPLNKTGVASAFTWNRSRACFAVVLMAVVIAGCDEQILHDLSEQDANKVLSRLSAGNLGAKKVLQSDGRWAISVPRDVIVPALAYLDTNRVLSPRASAVGNSGKSSFVPSREEQWFRYERSVAVSIEESLSAMLGVLEARVHLNLPETDPLFGTRKESTGSGSVLLIVDARYVAKDEDISGLVSGAAGIPAAKVAVLKSQAQMVEDEKQQVARLVESDPEIIQPTFKAVYSASIFAPEVGIASAAVVAFVGIGFFVLRSRRKKITFSLPTGIEAED